MTMININRFIIKKLISIVVFISFILLLSYLIVDLFKIINLLEQYKKPLAVLGIKEQEKTKNTYTFQGTILYMPPSEIICLLAVVPKNWTT